MELKKFPARSACTQRSVGSPRRGPLAGGTEMGGLRNGRSIKFRNLHVQHCNNLPVSPRLLAASCPLACGLVQTYLPTRATFGTLAGWSPARISLVKRQQGMTASPREISTQIPITHIAMGHDPTIAWKAPPTRTPPPICTSTPFLKPRWSQDRGRREHLNKYTMDDFSQSI